ncbi:MAG: twin-arginine translocase TatA/TatE family subunit [Flavobacteriaceae bacterium]
MILQTIFLGMVGPWQIAVIVVLVLLLFGGKKIPELMRGLGGGLKEFKNASKEDDEPEEETKENKK